MAVCGEASSATTGQAQGRGSSDLPPDAGRTLNAQDNSVNHVTVSVMSKSSCSDSGKASPTPGFIRNQGTPKKAVPSPVPCSPGIRGAPVHPGRGPEAGGLPTVLLYSAQNKVFKAISEACAQVWASGTIVILHKMRVNRWTFLPCLSELRAVGTLSTCWVNAAPLPPPEG